MAQPAQVGPYIANLELEQRRRELKAARFEPLVQSAFNITQLMFALDERRQARAKEKLETMHSIMEMWGADRMPQALLNEYGAAIDTLGGGRMVPRDAQGNVLPPELSIEQEGLRRLAQMKPEERNLVFDRMLGSKPTAAEQARLDETRIQDEKERAHWKIMESIAWAHQRGGGASWRNEPSQYTMSPEGYPVQAEPGDRRMTRGDLLEWDSHNSKTLQAASVRMRNKKLQREIKEDMVTGKMLIGSVIGISKLKDDDPNKKLLFSAFWEKWRKYETEHGQPDPGAPQPKMNWINRQLANIHQTLTAAIGPEPKFTPGKASASPAEPASTSPTDEVKRLEELFGAQP